MLRFMFGAAVASALCYVLSHRPEWLEKAAAACREHLAVAGRNLSAMSGQAFDDDAPTTIDFSRARRLAAQMEDWSDARLWAVMGDNDYDRRAAAGQILLARAGIPANDSGIDIIRQDYFRPRRPEGIMTGFSYLGLLALQDVSEEPVVRLLQGYVERHPQEQACDNALWALGELGSEDMIAYFFEVIENDWKYGPAARERAFCCLAQCGRYSTSRRLEMIPDFIRICEEAGDRQTRQWAMQALAHCAPRARCKSVEEWQLWWSENGERRPHLVEERDSDRSPVAD